MRLGPKRAVTDAPPSAKTKSATDIGRIVLPVLSASKPSTICRYSGTTKNVDWMMNAWHHCTMSPAFMRGDAEQGEVEQRLVAARLDPLLHAERTMPAEARR